MKRYILALGSNLDNRQENLKAARQNLSHCGTILKSSQEIETKPLTSNLYDTKNHENYLNQVLELRSTLNPDELYKKIVIIEDQLGHSRTKKWEPRQIDIDILYFSKDDQSCFESCTPLTYDDKDLKIPHQDVLNRPFLTNLISSITEKPFDNFH